MVAASIGGPQRCGLRSLPLTLYRSWLRPATDSAEWRDQSLSVEVSNFYLKFLRALILSYIAGNLTKNRVTVGMQMRLSIVGLFVLGSVLSACQPLDPDWANKMALELGAPRANAPEIRDRQTARFSAVSEERLLVEATQVLHDLGFTIEESTPRYGVLAGSKDRDATEAGEVAAQVVLTVGLALLGVRYNPVWDSDQVIRTTLTTQQIGKNESTLRISFERIVTNNQGISRVEELTAPEFSQGFLEKMRSGLAREGQGCSTLSTDAPLQKGIKALQSRGVSVLTEGTSLVST